MTDLVTVELEDLDARDGWILESRLDQQIGSEVGLIMVELLLFSSILSSARSHGFLRSMEITQESRSGDKRELF